MQFQIKPLLMFGYFFEVLVLYALNPSYKTSSKQKTHSPLHQITFGRNKQCGMLMVHIYHCRIKCLFYFIALLWQKPIDSISEESRSFFLQKSKQYAPEFLALCQRSVWNSRNSTSIS